MIIIMYGFTEISLQLCIHFRKLPHYFRHHLACESREKRHSRKFPCAENHEGPTSKSYNHSAPKWKYEKTSKQVAQSLFTS
jgi:hypothetical protein